MRKLVVIASVTLGFAGGASAQPLDPYGAVTPIAPVAAPEPGYEAMPAPEAAPPLPVAPAPVMPAPVPAPTVGPTPGYYYPPPGYAAPIYSYPPPPVYYTAPPPRRQRVRACVAGNCGPRPPMFSVGLRLTALGIDQQINGKDVVLGGVGAQLRFRSRGRFGLELSLDALHGGFDAPTTVAGGSGPGGTSPSGPYFHVGPVSRDSYPLSLSALIYIFPNQIERIFNLYFLGGVGVVGTTMSLTDENGNAVKQGFTELEAHLGLGAELRFRWLAIQADVRGLALARDDSHPPASYYAGVDGGPVPKSSSAVQGTLGATLWF
jgi:hypothetical protein